jgi:glycyl-tRNA synthetase beta subunit
MGTPFPASNYYSISLSNMESIEKRREKLKMQVFNLANDYNLDFLMEGKEFDQNLLAYYNSVAFIGTFKQEYLNLPEDLILTSLWEHNRAYGTRERGNNMGSLSNKFLFFLEYSNNINQEKVVAEYEQCINLRLQEAKIYFLQDSNVPMQEWSKTIGNIMFFEDKISMEEKRVKLGELLDYFNQKHSILQQSIIKELPNFLLDLNTKVVQEFNNLQGYMSYILFKNNMNTQCAEAILDYYRNNSNNRVGVFLHLVNQLYDVILTISLGGEVGGSGDPYNLKNPCDKLLMHSINLGIDLNLLEILQVLKNGSIPLPMGKNALNFIKNRFVNLLEQNYPLIKNHKRKIDLYQLIIGNYIIGYSAWQECKSIENILNNNQWQVLRNRLQGLIKKNTMAKDDVMAEVLESNHEDILMGQILNTLNQLDNFKQITDFLRENINFFHNYLENNKIQGFPIREKYIAAIIHNPFIALL